LGNKSFSPAQRSATLLWQLDCRLHSRNGLDRNLDAHDGFHEEERLFI